MRRVLFFILLLVASSSLDAREIYNLNQSWRYSSSYTISDITTTVSLPHVWDLSNSDEVFHSSGYYVKEVNIPDNFKNKDIYLRFGGVSSVATIFINGKYAYEHKGSYTAFNINITPFIQFGRYNSILVMVSNSPRADVVPYISDNKTYGGIHSSVEMIVTEPNHISLSHFGSQGIYVQTKSISGKNADLEATVMITGQPSKVVTVDINVSSDSNNVASATRNVRLDSNGDGRVVVPFSINNVTLWQGKEQPHIYNIDAAISVSNNQTDMVSTYFGVRKFEINDNNQFVLNGTPMLLNGVNVVQDNLRSGSGYNNVDIDNDMALISEIGANAVRVRGGAYSPATFEALSHEGIVAWVDMPLCSDNRYKGKGYIDNFYTKENIKEQFQEIIYQNFNHPSICFWGIFSELTSTGDSPIDYIEQMNKLVQSISPDRITVGSSIEDGYINNITKAISWPIYYGYNKSDISDFELWTTQLQRQHSNLKPAISEYGTNYSNVNYGDINLSQPTQTEFHEQYIDVLKRFPIFWGTFVNSMFDYTISDIDIVTGRNSCDMGLVDYSRNDKRDAFYLYKANWNKDDSFVHITNKENNKRSGDNQTIKAYTNEESAKLIVNGQFISEITVENGIAKWENIELKKGKNRVIISTNNSMDNCEIELYSSLLAQ